MLRLIFCSSNRLIKKVDLPVGKKKELYVICFWGVFRRPLPWVFFLGGIVFLDWLALLLTAWGVTPAWSERGSFAFLSMMLIMVVNYYHNIELMKSVSEELNKINETVIIKK